MRRHGRKRRRAEGAGARNAGRPGSRKEARVAHGRPAPGTVRGGLPRSALPTRYHDSYFKGDETEVLREQGGFRVNRPPRHQLATKKRFALASWSPLLTRGVVIGQWLPGGRDT